MYKNERNGIVRDILLFCNLLAPLPSYSNVQWHFFFTIAHQLLETLLGGLPVDNVPDRIKIFGLAVLILEAAKASVSPISKALQPDQQNIRTNKHAPKH